MLVGIRFCGGCNVRYDRKQYLEEIINGNPGHEFQFAKEDEPYELLLCICGCPSCCVSYEQFKYNRLVKVWDSTQPFFVD
ncbi:hypothetical protein M2140_000281 [Clostridiales Family XIII bacterium PM5-7]